MNLTVKLIDAETMVGGKKAVALCDAEGQMLPLQRAAKLEQEAGDISTLTVTFLIDGENIRWAE